MPRLTPQRFLAAAALITSCVSLSLAGPAGASSHGSAKLRAPGGYFGVVVGGPALLNPAQFTLMHQSGVQTVRALFNWSAIESSPGQFDFAQTDFLVAEAAGNGMNLLPIVMYTPQWASSKPSAPNFILYEPANVNSYTTLLRTLIARYGPRGTFWAQHPTLPKRPLRQWQIWNEPAFNYFWASQPYYKTYPKFLKAAYRAVHSADRGAKVVTAGLANNTANPSWKYLKRFYKYGLKGSFDILAAHPFASSISHLLTILKFDRDVMKKHGDGKKPLYLTEMSWPASQGQIPSSEYLGFETTPAKQAQLLQQAYPALLRNRQLRVRAAFWYQWASPYLPTSPSGQAISFNYSGLLKSDDAGNFTQLPALSAYSKTAHAYGG
jgi:hypothetical protein